jgi:uncharacterized damage-inducible protein DinB
VELTPDTASRYARLAFNRMLSVADRLGDARANERPIGPPTNSVAALIVHCCGVSEFWLGHVGVGRESTRAREDEFAATAPIAELREMVARSVQQVEDDLRAIEAGTTSAHAAGRQFLPGGDESDASLVLHVIEELFQHLGHCEIAADVLLAE